MMAVKEQPPSAVTDSGRAPKSQPQQHSNFNQFRISCQDDLSGPIAGIDLLTVVEAVGVALTKRGNHYSGLCPFHTEKTPSFSIFRSGNKWRFKCFGCGESGDAIDFVQKAYGLDFKDALGHLGLRPSKVTPELSRKIRRNRHGAELVSIFRKWVDRQIDFACFVIHTYNRMVQKIKTPSDMERYGRLYHLLAVAEYRHLWLCEASDVELYSLFREGGFYDGL